MYLISNEFPEAIAGALEFRASQCVEKLVIDSYLDVSVK